MRYGLIIRLQSQGPASMMGPLVVIRTFEGVGQSEDGCLEQEKNNTEKQQARKSAGRDNFCFMLK
jgi:hypothetical protein